jgi:hypothetical protein
MELCGDLNIFSGWSDNSTEINIKIYKIMKDLENFIADPRLHQKHPQNLKFILVFMAGRSTS